MQLKKLEMRNTFIKELVERARLDESIILIVGDLGFNVVEPFQNEFPKRFINAGISEQSMASMAAGLASEGFKVFIYSIANFPTFRCAEQIRNDICYHNLDVTIVSVGGGLAYGNLGYSHHAIQDYGLMRLFPEISIISPGDPNEVERCMDFIFRDKYPKYLRLRKAGERTISDYKNDINPGSWLPITIKDPDKILLSTGYGLKIARDISLTTPYKNFSIYSCPIWGQKYADKQIKNLEKFKKIITVEDHLNAGGFGSWLSENTKNSNKIESLYIKTSVIGMVGDEDYLLKTNLK
jgi:transketolase